MTAIANEDRPETEAGSGKAADPPPRRAINLRDTEAIKRELAKVYSEARRKTLDPNLASKLVYILSVAAKLVEQGDTDKRLVELEAIVASLGK